VAFIFQISRSFFSSFSIFRTVKREGGGHTVGREGKGKEVWGVRDIPVNDGAREGVMRWSEQVACVC
jgi:hypothetical protein